jgi:chemotaxis protein MotB
MKLNKILFFSTLCFFLFTACVSKKKYKDMESRYVSVENLLGNEREINRELASDTISLGDQNRYALQKIKELKEYNTYTQATLNKKIKDLEANITSKESAIAGRDEFMEELEAQVKQQEILLGHCNRELENYTNLVKQQNAVLDTLQTLVATRLKEMQTVGIDVVVKNGKVYISFSENFLFGKSLNYVSKEGKDALLKIAEVVKNQSDIFINIEGHTDTKSYKKGEIRNNWDMSALRAASVADVLTQSGVSAWRIVPSGRAEFAPLVDNNTSENRAINRRTEVILTPDLRPLLKLLEIK